MMDNKIFNDDDEEIKQMEEQIKKLQEENKNLSKQNEKIYDETKPVYKIYQIILDERDQENGGFFRYIYQLQDNLNNYAKDGYMLDKMDTTTLPYSNEFLIFMTFVFKRI